MIPISFIHHLLESLDNPYSLTRDDEASEKLQKIHDEIHQEGGAKHSDTHVYHVENGKKGIFHLSFVNNAVELHHHQPGVETGTIENGKPTNNRWVSTAKKLLDDHAFSKGRNVRIVGSPELARHYRTYTKLLAKVHKKSWNETTYEHLGKTHHQFELTESVFVDPRVTEVIMEGNLPKPIYDRRIENLWNH